MLAHTDDIKKELEEKIPSCQKSAMNAGKFLKEVLNQP
jgi:hypothetical protein